MNNDNNDAPMGVQSNTFNPLETYTKAMATFEMLIKDCTESNKQAYEGMLTKTIEAYYSFMDAQMQMDELAKMRAKMVASYEEQANMEFTFEPDFTTEGDVIKPDAFNNKKESNDDDDEPTLNWCYSK